MDVKFNADAAEKLIESMDRYCLEISGAAAESLELLNYSDGWRDSRKESFSIKIDEMYQGLQQALYLESEYMKIYIERVKELRG